MKSIIYILIAAFISSIVISAFPGRERPEKQVFTLSCVDESNTEHELKLSAEIFKSRLIDCGIEHADVQINKKSASVVISIGQQVDAKEIANLLTSKGNLKFYETYDRLELIENLGIDEELSSLLTRPTDGDGQKGTSGTGCASRN